MEDLGKPKSGAAQLFICFGFYNIFKNTKKEQYGNSETIENVKKLNNYFFVSLNSLAYKQPFIFIKCLH